LLIIIPLFITIKVKENFQGRVAGIEQIGQNFTSIFGQAEGVNLENNEIWRLLWWSKIIDYSFTTNSFFYGKGVGMSLAQTDDILTEEDLRSPHNFHLTIMARFGVIVFFIWLYWIVLTLKPLFSKKLSPKMLAITCIIIAFLFNASFDVFLEGPMGAFPFWTFVGLLYIEEFKEKNINESLVESK
jgi:O-antigen ligase